MMSPKQVAETVWAAEPGIMIPNFVNNVFKFTQKVKRALEGEGYTVKYVGKTKGEGQYTPEGFESRWVKVGTEEFFITGVSHDALYVNGQQYDFVGAGNDSFDSIPDVARPTANLIPKEYWRKQNPPIELKSTDGSIGTPVPMAPKNKPYIGDEFWAKVGEQLEKDYFDYNQRLNAGSLVWIGRLSHTINVEGMQPEAAVQKHRAEWLKILRG